MVRMLVVSDIGLDREGVAESRGRPLSVGGTALRDVQDQDWALLINPIDDSQGAHSKGAMSS